MVQMFASRTPVVRCAGAAVAVLALTGLAGCGSTKTSTSSPTTSMPVVTQTATTGTDAGSGDATSTGTSTSDGSGTGTSTADRTGTSTSTSTSTHSSTGTSTSTSTHSSTSTASATGSASSTTGIGTSADTHECRTGQLRADAYPLTQTATHEQMALTFTNTSSAACTMRGYPGADLMDRQRTVAHARRVQNAPITTVVLRPGATARAILDSVKGEIASGFLVVTPPNQQQSMPVQLVMPAKAFSVGPVTLDAGH